MPGGCALLSEICAYAMKRSLKRLLKRSGWLCRRTKGLPYGVLLEKDIKLLSGDAAIRTVFDVGANRGDWAIECLEMFGDCEVYCFEPLEEAYRLLANRVRCYQGLHAIKCALGSSQGEQTLMVNENAEMATLRPSQTRGVINRRTIEVETLDGLMHSQDDLRGRVVDLLKIDTEGYEIEVLKGAVSSMKEGRIKFIYAEVSLRLGDAEHTDFEALNRFLHGYGFNFVALYDQCVWENSYFGYCNALFKSSRA